MLNSRVVFPPVTIKLHWPDVYSPCCLTEVTALPLNLYECVSCGRISLGRTEYVEGKVIAYGDVPNVDTP